MNSMHVLVPIDFSTYTEHTLNYATQFAKQLQANVTLLHVVDLPTMVHQGLDPYLIKLKATAKQLLDRCAQRLHEAGLATTPVLSYGVPFQEIIDFANAEKVDLIIIGTHGRTGLRHVLLGSVTERVVRLAACPVLVTRLPAHEGGAEKPEAVEAAGQGA